MIDNLVRVLLFAGVATLCGCAVCSRGGYTMEHTAIDVADPVATANWWVENLGFEITSQRDDVTHTTFIVDRGPCNCTLASCPTMLMLTLKG